jgi:hypothetical protein
MYPSAVKGATYQTISDGIAKLLTAIQDGGKFWIPEDPTKGVWPTQNGAGVVAGVNMGAFFQEGYFSLKNLFETENGKPVFYVDGVKLNTANYVGRLNNAESDFGFKARKDVVNNFISNCAELDEFQHWRKTIDGYILEANIGPSSKLLQTLFEKYYK